MDLRKLKTLIDLVSESDIAELEITEGEGKVRIVKAAAPRRVQRDRRGAPCRCAARSRRRRRRRRRAGRAAAAPSRPATSSSRRWSAPSTARASPGAKPFVEVGSQVKDGETALHHRGDEAA